MEKVYSLCIHKRFKSSSVKLGPSPTIKQRLPLYLSFKASNLSSLQQWLNLNLSNNKHKKVNRPSKTFALCIRCNRFKIWHPCKKLINYISNYTTSTRKRRNIIHLFSYGVYCIIGAATETNCFQKR